jgi:predicted 3-demethylubiquinone-9 3-methyltransferase (glyoxalase superfamily)
MSGTPKIKNVMWFDGEAEAAAKHYMAAFRDAELVHVERYGKAGPGPEGTVMVIEFDLAGQRFVGLNGGPLFKPNEAVSFLITCEDQAEVDRLWSHMSEGGSTSMCGWLKDRWGFSWQIAPRRFFEMMATGDAAQKTRVFAAMMQMTKFDVAALEKAYAGG